MQTPDATVCPRGTLGGQLRSAAEADPDLTKPVANDTVPVDDEIENGREGTAAMLAATLARLAHALQP